MIYSLLLIFTLSTMQNDSEKKVTITVASPKKAGNLERRGYVFPTERVQRTRSDGSPYGWRLKYILPHTLEVKLSDLPKWAHYRVDFTCADCGNTFSTAIAFYNSRKTDFCRDCFAKRLVYTKDSVTMPFGTRGRDYWKRTLIDEAVSPCCEISGNTDRRFLVIHHLMPTGKGGPETFDNVVIITANYHQAYHKEMGNNQSARVNKESYLAFKARELQKLAALRSHTQGA